MEEQKQVSSNLKDEIEKGDFGIFQNQDEVVENIKAAAEIAGISTDGIDKLKEEKPLEFFVAKKSCKMCWGKGTVDFIPNEPKNVRNSSLPEDRNERHERINKALCKCVRIQME